jgi:hypothetical protein
MSTPPPFPPGPGLEWVPLEEYVDLVVADALAFLDEMIEAEPDPDLRAALRSRQPWAADQVEQIVRTYYATGAAN